MKELSHDGNKTSHVERQNTAKIEILIHYQTLFSRTKQKIVVKISNGAPIASRIINLGRVHYEIFFLGNQTEQRNKNWGRSSA